MSGDDVLGWYVYTGPHEDELEFREFVPAPGLDEKIADMTDELMAEIGEASRPCSCASGAGSRIRRVLSAAGRYLRGDSR